MPVRPPRSPRAPSRCGGFLALLGAAALLPPAVAGGEPGAVEAVVATGSAPLETSTAMERLVAGEGPDGPAVRRYVEARRLEAGEQVYYTVRVRNPGKEAVRDVVVTKRLPYGVEYVPGSAVGPACVVELSSDGGQTFARVRGKGSYTHVRWIFEHPLAPGATALLRFRAVFL